MRPLLIALILLLPQNGGTPATKGVPLQDAPEQQEPLPPDVKVGKAAFHILKSGGEEMSVEPLLTPSFKLARIAGTTNPDTSIIQCDVIKRVMGFQGDDAFIITVLKCGNSEYAIKELDFVPLEGK